MVSRCPLPGLPLAPSQQGSRRALLARPEFLGRVREGRSTYCPPGDDRAGRCWFNGRLPPSGGKPGTPS